MSFNPNLNRLQIFREVVLAGSFSKAALILKQPKSRVSRHLAALEQDMGVQLIYRTTRQFQLTQAGRELYQRAAPLILELSNTLDEIHSEGDEMSGLIRVTVPVDVGSELMGKFCADYMKVFPKIQFAVIVTNEYVDLVRESVDLAIRIGRNKDSTLIQKKVGMIGTIPVMSKDLYDRNGGVQRPEQLEEIPILEFSGRDLRRYPIKLQNAKETRTLKFKSHFTCNNFFTIRSMTIEGAGVSFLPAYLVKESLQKGELIQVLKDWTTELVQVHIMIPNQKSTPIRIKKFVDFIQQRLAQFL